MLGCTHACNGHSGGTVAASNVGHLTAGACRDQACKGHKLTNGTLCYPSSELEEGEDEDSSSERSSCASSSTNQKDGKYCDCCYCEFFGHNAPPAAPTSRNYAEIREKLRSRLTRRKEELPQRQDSELTATGSQTGTAQTKKKEKAQQGSVGTAGSDPQSSPPELAEEHVADGADTGRLLDWPQLELERVNSFLTSRLEEIKNTIKDSIRASFSMYDLNLDVNDFPKKAATLESNHLLSHLNGSSDLQQIDLDLAPLSLGSFKSHLDLVNGWEEGSTTVSSSNTTTTTTTTASSVIASACTKDIQRLHTTPTLSKLIRVRSPEKCTSTGLENSQELPAQTTTKTKEDALDLKNTAPSNGGPKSKKNKKQQKQDQHMSEHNSNKTTKALAVYEMYKTTETKITEAVSNGSKHLNKHLQHSTDSQKNGPKKTEESKPPRNASNGTHGGMSNVQKGKGDTETGRPEHTMESKAHSNIQANGQQPQVKGKNKKNKNKGEKSSTAIDDVFLPKDVDPTEMDEIDREVEYFKRFCLDSAKQTRQKVAVNWSNFSLKKVPSNAAQ
ncbi:hypothetical protein WMY93_009020 [Mugilogobius chulae]|uniref:FAM193 C-terminal domain-containing protein n=1 Tax=Mugilogobius chulae TaxID=88201 RepID=A0AAW0PDV7_9GOBI